MSREMLQTDIVHGFHVITLTAIVAAFTTAGMGSSFNSCIWRK